MFLSPIQAIEEKWITHPECETIDDWKERKFVSPNAIDFTIDRLFSINHNNGFHISEGGKQMRGGSEIPLVCDRTEQLKYWKIDERTCYDALSNMYVEVPDGAACMLIVRSSFGRNGLFITSGLYDSGFKGHIGFVLHNNSGPAYIASGTRIGQIMFIESNNALRYAGQWNHEAGTEAPHIT